MYIDKDQDHKNRLKEYNKELDRYRDIRCNESNNVPLPDGRYINASYIGVIFRTNYFITTQAPKKNTIEDFWEMVFKEKTKVIVMLCNLVEGGKTKCENYITPEQAMKNFNLVETKKEENEEYDVRTLDLIKLNREANTGTIDPNATINEKRTITHIHYKKWPDKGVPNIDSFKTFEKIIVLVDRINKVKVENEKEDELHPIVVHCSAGVGRTGTFISMFCLYKEIKMAQIDKGDEVIEFNIFNLVRKMKEMRLHMVQAFEQYKFVYQFAKYLLDNYNKKDK